MYAVKDEAQDEVKRLVKSIASSSCSHNYNGSKDVSKVALDWASQNVEQRLTNNGDTHDLPLLHWATQYWHTKVVSMLLEISADSGRLTDMRHQDHDPLDVAIENGQEAIVHLLLDKGAMVPCVRSILETYHTAWSCSYHKLIRAAEMGHIGILQLLVDVEIYIAAKHLHRIGPCEDGSWNEPHKVIADARRSAA